MPVLYSFLFIVIIFGAIGILYIYQYNKLQHSKTKIDHAESLIDEALRTKYDILVQADQYIKKELKSTKSFFKDLDKLKEKSISNFDLDRKIKEFVSILQQVNLDHPKLTEEKTFKQFFVFLNKADEKLQAAKSYYNKYTSEMNDLIRTFPSNIVARMHKMEIKTFFDGKNLEDTIVDDFKL